MIDLCKIQVKAIKAEHKRLTSKLSFFKKVDLLLSVVIAILLLAILLTDSSTSLEISLIPIWVAYFCEVLYRHILEDRIFRLDTELELYENDLARREGISGDRYLLRGVKIQ